MTYASKTEEYILAFWTCIDTWQMGQPSDRYNEHLSAASLEHRTHARTRVAGIEEGRDQCEIFSSL